MHKFLTLVAVIFLCFIGMNAYSSNLGRYCVFGGASSDQPIPNLDGQMPELNTETPHPNVTVPQVTQNPEKNESDTSNDPDPETDNEVTYTPAP